MTPDASGWRSSARYERVEGLTPSDLAWEWLRRNESYDRDFQTLADANIASDPLTDKIRQRWGLRFPGGPVAGLARSASVLAP